MEKNTFVVEIENLVKEVTLQNIEETVGRSVADSCEAMVDAVVRLSSED